MTQDLNARKEKLSWTAYSDVLPENSAAVDSWLATIMANHQQQPYSLWLDSAATAHANSRFHILLKQPRCFIQATETGAELTACDVSWITPELSAEIAAAPSFLAAADKLNQCLQQHYTVTPHPQIPFNGGLAGYLSYDLGRQIERLPAINHREYQTPVAGLGFYSEALVVDQKQHQLWVLAAANQHQHVLESWLNPTAEAAPQTPFSLTSGWQSNMDASSYKQRFERVHEYLLAGDCYQINLAQRFKASYQGDEYQAYLRLREQNAAPFSAFMRLPGSSILSVSPERFLAVDAQRRVETKPIKGTRPRATDTAADQQAIQALQQSEKDRAENLMIVDLLRNDLSRSCLPGTVDVPHLFAIESFPAVHHLVSTVKAQLDPNKSVIDLYQGAFPGGSITGAPKVRAMQIIEELEPNRRSVYCGSMLYLSLCGSSDSSITIRTLLAESGQLYCWAGGGLVVDSQSDAEYQETLDKVARILPILESS